MLFLEQLLEQMDIAGGILAEQGTRNLIILSTNNLNYVLIDIVLSNMKEVELANKKAIGNYISKLM